MGIILFFCFPFAICLQDLLFSFFFPSNSPFTIPLSLFQLFSVYYSDLTKLWFVSTVTPMSYLTDT